MKSLAGQAHCKFRLVPGYVTLRSSCNRPGSCRSFATLHIQAKDAMFLKVGIIIKSRNFHPIHCQRSTAQSLRSGNALALKNGEINRCHTGNGQGCGTQWTDVNRLTEREVIGIKVATSAGQNAIAEHVLQRGLYPVAEVV